MNTLGEVLYGMRMIITNVFKSRRQSAKKDTSHFSSSKVTLEQKKVYFDRSNLPKDTNQIVPFRFVVTEFIFNYSKAKVSPKQSPSPLWILKLAATI